MTYKTTAQTALGGTLSRYPLVPKSSRPLDVFVPGGGPSGLIFALILKLLLRDEVRITVQDARWTIKYGRMEWKGKAEGNNRRKQVVTLQSMVFGRFPAELLALIFPDGSFCENWPHGPESPVDSGYPRNIRISDLEDRLLAAAISMGLTLICGPVDPAKIELEAWDLIACADGPTSKTRTHFENRFGKGDPAPFSINGKPVTDTVLAVRVRSSLRDVDTVALTVAQNRFLYNGLGGGVPEGYVYMRLTEAEASEVFGLKDGLRQPCTQKNPSVVGPAQGAVFAPSVDPTSPLWPRVLDGLALYGMGPEDVLDMSSFSLSMVSRPRAVTLLSDHGAPRQTFGALLGDAASSIHFWPGRGLAGGASMATALAHVVAQKWGGRGLRNADLAMYEASFAALKHRHADRAWRAMVRQTDNGLEPIHALIARAIAQQDRGGRATLINQMQQRIETIATRLQDRMPAPVDVSSALLGLQNVSTETLSVLVDSQGWDGWASGGSEVDLMKMIA